MNDIITFADSFAETRSDAGISPATVRRVFDAILAGSWTPAQIAGFVIALEMSGKPPGVIAAAATALRNAMVPVEHGLPRVLDTCGTGGDGSGSVNLSTGAAIIAAAAGVPVAKHGNRAVSSQTGAADVLEALGVAIDTPATAAAELLRDVGIAFLLAPTFHPAMRHAGVARKELGVRTIFNCLGPLASPALATHQLLGAYEDALRDTFAQTLRELGTKRAWVVRGADGLDELSPFGATYVTELSDGKISEFTVSPADFGLSPSSPGAIAGGDAATNARILETVLSGQPHVSRDAFVLNAAAALVVADALEPKAATARVLEVLESGRAKAKLDELRAASHARRTSP